MLSEQIPRAGPLEKLERFNRENYGLFRAYLQSHRNIEETARLVTGYLKS